MKKSSASLFRKVLLILFSATLLEGVVFVSSLYFSGSFDQIKKNSISLYEQRIDYRKDMVAQLLVSDIYDEKNFEQIFAHCNALYEANKIHGKDTAMTKELLDDMVNFLHFRSFTGAYLILDKDIFQTSYYPTLYLRDASPNASYTDNSDITGKYGNADLLKQYNLSLESTWMPSMRIDESDPTYDFYYQTMQVAKQHPELNSMDLGYWGEPITLNDDLLSVFTYSIPLIAKDGTVYGVVGIDITTDFLKSLLPYKELNDEDRNTYIIAKKNKDSYQTMLSYGPAYDYLFKKGTTLSLDEQVEGTSYVVSSEKLKDKVLGHASPLSFYGQNSPYANQSTWYLIGIANESELLRSSHALIKSSQYAIFLAVLVGIGAAILISYKFTNPIIALVQQLKNSNPKESVSLPRVNIDEIDELSNSIEIFSQGLIGAESRLSQIIYSLDIPIGAIEIFENGRIYCTEKISELLNFDSIYHQETFFTKEIFDVQILHLKQKSELYEEYDEKIDGKLAHIYVCSIQTEKQNKKWLRFILSKQNASSILIVMDVTKEFEEKEHLTYERNHDGLTGLLNRRAFGEQVEQLLQKSDLDHCAMVLWDLDNLKFVNDTYGHDGGDLLIRSIARILETAQQDHGIPARMAGDEFLVFYHCFDSKEQLLSKVKELHHRIMQTQINFQNHDSTYIKVSAGIAFYPDDALTYDDLLHFADFAMYDAKNFQKGSIRCFNEQLYQHNRMLMNGRKELNAILDGDMVSYAFQPIVNAKDGSILGFEALMRPQGEFLTSPQDIMLLARAQSQLYRVEYLTWTQSIKQFVKANAFNDNLTLFINSIPSVPMLEDLIKELEQNYAQQLPHLVVELIETDEIELQYLQVKQDFMIRWNGKMAIDDFGSGYNSDTTLLNIQADYIKIDIELIHNIDTDNNRQLMVKNIIDFAHQKGTYVIAEGVETKNEMETLIALRVDYMQGFYLGKPAFEVKDIDQTIKKEIQACMHTLEN